MASRWLSTGLPASIQASDHADDCREQNDQDGEWRQEQTILPVQGRPTHVATIHANQRVQEVGRILQVREPAEPAQQNAQAGECNSMELAAPLPSKHRRNVRQVHVAPANEGQAEQAQ